MEMWNSKNQETDFTKINNSCIEPALELQIILDCGISQGKIIGDLKSVSSKLLKALPKAIWTLQIKAEQLRDSHIEAITQKRFKATGMHPLDKNAETKYGDIYSNVSVESQVVTKNHINQTKLSGLCSSYSVEKLIALAESKAEGLNSLLDPCSIYSLIPITLTSQDFLEHIKTMEKLQQALEVFIKSAKLSQQTAKELDS